jgi:D-alanyl-D-alanine carboxypeptidase (penicillin-binding protein 5/6)
MRGAKFPIILALLALSLITPFSRARGAQIADVQASAAVLFEVNSGKILYEKSMTQRRSPDNLIKIMTLLTAARFCENGDVALDDEVTVDASAWSGISGGGGGEPGRLQPGERVRFIDLLHMAYFGVEDAACNAVATHSAGSVEKFVEAMNTLARSLGCGDTNFTNTHGAIDSEQYTTARDLAVIMIEASRHSLFVDVAGAYSATLRETDFNESREINSPNYMLNEASRYYYRYATAVRTSGTYENGYGLAASARREDMSLVTVVLGASAVILEDESTQMQNLTEGRRLFEWGFENFGWRTILSSGELVAKAPVKYGDGADAVLLRPSASIEALVSNDVSDEAFTRSVTVYPDRDGVTLQAPVERGTILGEITVYLDGENFGTRTLVANTGVELLRVKYIEDQVRAALGSKWARFAMFLLFVLFAVYVALVIRYNKLRRDRLRRIKQAKQRIIDEAKEIERERNEWRSRK